MAFPTANKGFSFQYDPSGPARLWEMEPAIGTVWAWGNDVVETEPALTLDYKDSLTLFAPTPDLDSLFLENIQLRNLNIRLEKGKADWKQERAIAENRNTELEAENAQLRQQVLDLAHLRDMLLARWRWLVALRSHPYPKRTLEDFGYSES